MVKTSQSKTSLQAAADPEAKNTKTLTDSEIIAHDFIHVCNSLTLCQ